MRAVQPSPRDSTKGLDYRFDNYVETQPGWVSETVETYSDGKIVQREADTVRAYLSSWLATYPRDGFFHGHLSWHLSLCEIQAGNWPEALSLYHDAIALHRHSGGPQQRMSDGAAFLWRSELAGHPRDGFKDFLARKGRRA